MDILEEHVIKETEKWWEIAKKELNISAGNLMVEFSLTGKTAGIADTVNMKINYNFIIIEENFHEFCLRTIPHEVAHIAANLYFKDNCGHGKGWVWVMEKVFKVKDVTRCHNYDISAVFEKRGKEVFEYVCGCKTKHYISKTIHNKIQNGQKRHCTKCKTGIYWIKGEI